MPPKGGANTGDDAGDDDVDEQTGREYVCGADTANTDDPCQFPVSGPDQRCPNHPADGSGPPEGSGSGDPGHAMGDGNGRIQERLPENAKPAMKHGIHAVQDDPFGTLDWLEEQNPDAYDWIIGRWRSYLADAPFGEDSGKADDLLTACLFDFAVRTHTHIQVLEGLTKTEKREAESGFVFEQKVEHAGNLPADRLARRSESMKKKLGVLDDPESAKADAMSGWGDAARRVASRVDDDADDDVPEVVDHA